MGDDPVAVSSIKIIWVHSVGFNITRLINTGGILQGPDASI
jgi:hypothetical protein